MSPADLRVMRLLVDAALAQRAAPEDARAREDYAEAVDAIDASLLLRIDEELRRAADAARVRL